MCDLLTVMDAKIVQVALSGLENILRFGEQVKFLTASIWFIQLWEKLVKQILVLVVELKFSKAHIFWAWKKV